MPGAGPRPPSLLVVDADHFKKINDALRHDTGDKVLAEMGRLLRASCRQGDVPARYGGEEFIVLLRDAQNCAERLLEQIRDAEPTGVFVTASIGVATFRRSGCLLLRRIVRGWRRSGVCGQGRRSRSRGNGGLRSSPASPCTTGSRHSRACFHYAARESAAATAGMATNANTASVTGFTWRPRPRGKRSAR
jgi:hypothetical protein